MAAEKLGTAEKVGAGKPDKQATSPSSADKKGKGGDGDVVTNRKSSGVSALREYFSESWSELQKVTHPSWPETMQATLVTGVIMLFVAISLFLMDLVFNTLIGILIK